MLRLPDHELWYEQTWRDPWVFPDPDGDGWSLIGFVEHADGEFVGELSDPVPVRYDPTVGLVARQPAPVGR
ncbi:hypothetical protein [Verrucosispora sp. WMMD573]|uniref:hypothetical protein n=1 Tax=Verrucosispora sp. WMMD573 TaxID=3015149 RepID=UPI00248A9633|nr:hypothetical protein [Verrucosispora sp. WMMD573]WBB52905.1 hypothetical protein O7601_20285 [Verrucosispora sp. WMMD573]